MYSLCYGCMKLKQGKPRCELCGFDENSENGNHQLPLGTLVGGQYILGRVLGQGGFGITYLGWDRVLDKRVAVKEYFPSGYAGRDTRDPLKVTSYDNHSSHDFENNKKRFLREAESLAKLWEVPQIVKVLRHFEENGTAYIAMEYVEGMELGKYLRKLGRPMTVKETLKILGPVMEGLKQVHSVGLVHRDISPDNIMVQPDGSAKLLDFGAARYVENANAEKDRNTSTQAILKHGFAPPEQYRSHGALGPWSDIYAMCATVYYCLTGKVPPEALGRTMEGEQIDWNAVPGLNARQRAALSKGMELLPKNRFASVEELRRELIPDAPVKIQKPVEQKVEQKTQVQKVTAEKQPKRKKKWVPAFVSLLLIVVLSLGAFLVYSENAYTYELTDTGATITGYSGVIIPSSLNIPAKIVGYPVTAIGKGAFQNCSNITEIVLPDSIRSIGDSAFAGCTELVEITIPAGVKSIGNSTFRDCKGLTQISIPASVTSIGNNAFYNCAALTEIELPDGVTNIGDNAFRNCDSLTAITIPEGVIFLPDDIFYGCDNLLEVHLPQGIRTIGNRAFYYCEKLTQVNIPGSVSAIGNCAFMKCSALTAITIPAYVKSIEEKAFYGCRSLAEVSFSGPIQTIGTNAFYECPKLGQVTVPWGCTIYDNAFPATCKVNRE